MNKHLSVKSVGIDPRLFRVTVGQFATGVIVITTEYQGEIHGMTANAFMSGSITPPLVIISVSKRARMHQWLTGSGNYSVSVLANDQEPLSRHFSGTPVKQQVCFARHHGHPVLEGAIAWISTSVVHQYDCGDHTLFVGMVIALHHSEEQGALGFHRGQYVNF